MAKDKKGVSKIAKAIDPAQQARPARWRRFKNKPLNKGTARFGRPFAFH
jgi:hypothetical protein